MRGFLHFLEMFAGCWNVQPVQYSQKLLRSFHYPAPGQKQHLRTLRVLPQELMKLMGFWNDGSWQSRYAGLGYFPTNSLLSHGERSCTKIHIESISCLHNICTYGHLLCDLYARSVGKTGGMKAIPSDLSATDIKNLGIHTAATSAFQTLGQILTTNICLPLMNTTC